MLTLLNTEKDERDKNSISVGLWVAGRGDGKECAYLVIINDPARIIFSAEGAAPKFLDEPYAMVGFGPCISIPKKISLQGFAPLALMTFFFLSQKIGKEIRETEKN